MTNAEIIEGNKLIAVFMGFIRKQGALEHYSVPKGQELEYKAFTIALKNMPYHSSWDWLMPVVEKIDSLEHKGFPICVGIGGDGVAININEGNWMADKYSGNREIANTMNINYFHDNPNDANRSTKIQGVWVAVVRFVEWYNQNKE